MLYLDYKPDALEPPTGDAAAKRARVVVRAMAIRMDMSQEVVLQIGRAVWEDDNLHFVWLLWMNRVFWGVDLGDDEDGGDGDAPAPDTPPPPSGSGPGVGLHLTLEPAPKKTGGA